MGGIIQFAQENKILVIILGGVISAVLSVIAYFVQRKAERILRKVVVAIVVFVLSFSIYFIPTVFVENFQQNSLPEEEVLEIPENVTQSPFKLILLEYLGEFYYENTGKKEFISDKLEQISVKVDLYSEDYHRHYTEYTVRTNDWNEITYCFDEIPAGNYTIMVSADGYQTRKETVSFDTSDRSTSLNEESF